MSRCRSIESNRFGGSLKPWIPPSAVPSAPRSRGTGKSRSSPNERDWWVTVGKKRSTGCFFLFYRHITQKTAHFFYGCEIVFFFWFLTKLDTVTCSQEFEGFRSKPTLTDSTIRHLFKTRIITMHPFSNATSIPRRNVFFSKKILPGWSYFVCIMFFFRT